MGMSVSQTRLLALTSRMNDLEYKAENIANIKVRLADESEKIAKKYTDELNKQRYTFTSYSSNGQIQTNYLDGAALAWTGQPSVSGYYLAKKGTDGKYHETWSYNGVNSYQLYQMIESGEFCIFKEKEAGSDVNRPVIPVNIASESLLGMDSVDSATLAKAEAEYNAATSKIQRKEKELDRQQSKLDTEHEALKTERDSLKEIIRDNVDNTFKLFG